MNFSNDKMSKSLFLLLLLPFIPHSNSANIKSLRTTLCGGSYMAVLHRPNNLTIELRTIDIHTQSTLSTIDTNMTYTSNRSVYHLLCTRYNTMYILLLCTDVEELCSFYCGTTRGRVGRCTDTWSYEYYKRPQFDKMNVTTMYTLFASTYNDRHVLNDTDHDDSITFRRNGYLYVLRYSNRYMPHTRTKGNFVTLARLCGRHDRPINSFIEITLMCDGFDGLFI
jgi:hypothetical protein